MSGRNVQFGKTGRTLSAESEKLESCTENLRHQRKTGHRKHAQAQRQHYYYKYYKKYSNYYGDYYWKKNAIQRQAAAHDDSASECPKAHG